MSKSEITASEITFKNFIEFMLAKTLLKLFGWLPLRVSSKVGNILGAFLATLPLKKNAIARQTIETAYGDELNEEQIRKIQYGATCNIIQNLTEFPAVYTLNKRQFEKNIAITGLDILQKHPDALVLTAHYGNWELILKMAGIYEISMANVYRRANNPLTDRLITEMRSQPLGLQIPKGKQGGRDLIKSLKEGRCIGFLNDQKLNDGIPSPFFGKEVMTAPSLAEMALKYDRPVVPIFCERTPHNSKLFHIKISEPLTLENSGTKEQNIATNTALFNKVIEEQIRCNPKQWMWFHRRF